MIRWVVKFMLGFVLLMTLQMCQVIVWHAFPQEGPTTGWQLLEYTAFHRALDRERLRANVQPLSVDSRLAPVATDKAQALAYYSHKRGEFVGHDFYDNPQREKWDIFRSHNISTTHYLVELTWYVSIRTVASYNDVERSVLEAFLSSPGHGAPLLDPDTVRYAYGVSQYHDYYYIVILLLRRRTS